MNSYLNLSGSIWINRIHMNLPESIWIFPNLSESSWICLKLSIYLSIYLLIYLWFPPQATSPPQWDGFPEDTPLPRSLRGIDTFSPIYPCHSHTNFIFPTYYPYTTCKQPICLAQVQPADFPTQHFHTILVLIVSIWSFTVAILYWLILPICIYIYTYHTSQYHLTLSYAYSLSVYYLSVSICCSCYIQSSNYGSPLLLYLHMIRYPYIP